MKLNMKARIQAVKELNEQPYVLGEGVKTFDPDAFVTLREMLLKTSDNPNTCLSVNQKLQLQCYVQRGELFNKITSDCGKIFKSFLPIKEVYGMQCVVDHLFGYGRYFQKIYHQPFNGSLILDCEGIDELLTTQLKWYVNREVSEGSWKSVKIMKLLCDGIDLEKIL